MQILIESANAWNMSYEPNLKYVYTELKEEVQPLKINLRTAYILGVNIIVFASDALYSINRI